MEESQESNNTILLYGLLAILLLFAAMYKSIFDPVLHDVSGGIPSFVDLPDRAEVAIPTDVIGNEVVEALFTRPEITLHRWGDEESLVVSRAGSYLPYESVDNSRQWSRTDKDEIVVLEPVSGGVEIDVVLESEPESNVFEFLIGGYQDFDFYYQSALTEEELAAGDQRPEHVVGSYAVYHKNKLNYDLDGTNYAAGKAFHIYRPKVYEVNNPDNWTWAELSYLNGVLSVTVPQDFLDSATYPVRVDPTFGYTTVGLSTTSNYTENTMRTVSPYTPAGNGYVHGVVAYTQETNGAGAEFYLRAVVYEKDSSLITYGDEYSFSGLWSWRYLNVDSAAVTNGTDYNVGIWLPLPRIALKYDDSAGYNLVRDDETYASTSAPSSTWVTAATSSDRQYSIYAVYSDSDVEYHQEIYGLSGYHLFTVPADVSSIDVECWGAGGAGYDNNNAGGGGGGGGAYAATADISVSEGQQYTIYVGVGGTTGTDGGDSTFATTTVVAAGGSTATGQSGAAGGTTGDSTGDTEYNGGDGGDGNNAGAQDQSGGGAAAGCASGDGGDGQDGSALDGGGDGGDTACGATGGAGGSGDGVVGESNVTGGAGGGGGDNGAAGANGGGPGGGGGGGETGKGDGEDGQCIITYIVSAETPAAGGDQQSIFFF